MPKCLFPNVHLINGLELQPRLAHKSLFSPTSLLNYRKNIPSLHFESQNQQIHKGGEKEAINFTLEEVVVYLKDFIPTWFRNIVYGKGNPLETHMILKLSETRKVYLTNVGSI